MNARASNVYVRMKFLMSLAHSAIATTYGLYFISGLGLNPLQLLLVGTALEVTVLVFEGITGVVADTYGRKLSVVSGVFVVAAGFLLQGCVPWLGAGMASLFVWLLAAQLFYGIGDTLVSGADTAWIADEAGEEELGKLFLRTNRLSLIAGMLGIGLSVGFSALGYNMPSLFAGVVYIGLGVYLLLAMKETSFVRPERSDGSSPFTDMRETWLSGAKVVRRQPVLVLLLAATLFGGAASEGYDRLWEAHLLTDIGFPRNDALSAPLWFGLIAFLSSLLGMSAVWLAEKYLNVGSERSLAASLMTLTGLRLAAVLSFALAPNFAWALVSLLAIGVIGALSGPVYDTWLNKNIESSVRATVLSMMSQSNALGQTAGGPFVGWIGHRLSVRASLIAAAVLLAPIMAVYAKALRKRT